MPDVNADSTHGVGGYHLTLEGRWRDSASQPKSWRPWPPASRTTGSDRATLSRSLLSPTLDQLFVGNRLALRLLIVEFCLGTAVAEPF